MMWLHYSPEWFEESTNPRNGSVRLISQSRDMGYIFGGVEEKKLDLLLKPLAI